VVLAVMVTASVASAHREDPDPHVPVHDHEYPLRRSRLVLRDGRSPAMHFKGKWSGAADRGDFDPTTSGATLRVSTTTDGGDSGTIRLPAAGWTARGSKVRYRDPSGAAGGIRKLVFQIGKRGGHLAMKAGGDAWRYRLRGEQGAIAVALEIGTARWCAAFSGSDLTQRVGRRVRAASRVPPPGCACEALVAGTFDGIQTLFEQRGCTAAVCHGAAPGQGDLDLRPAVAYESLVGVPSTIDPSIARVLPGDDDHSLLWQKLAVLTEGLPGVPGSGMPVGTAPLTEEELRLVSLWIYNGAPPTGIVPGSESLLLDSCRPSPTPSKIPPPTPPNPQEGVQMHGPPWSIPVLGEDEVCYATYYDFSDVVPAESRGPCPEFRGGPARECLFYNRAELIQDPNSHHSIPRTYVGEADVTHPAFGPFTCHGGAADGTPCDPMNLGVPAPAGAECGAGGGCAGRVVSSVACLTYGPPDFGQGFNLAESAGAPDVFVATEPRHVLDLPTGVMDAIPVAGIMVWNSHAFNITPEPTTNEQWLRFFYAPADEQQFLLQDFFHVRDIFIMDVPPFERREYCTTLTFKPGTRLFEMMSHTHKRGDLFELWGPGGTEACESFFDPSCGPDAAAPVLRTTDYSDPDVVVFDPPLVLDGDAADRTVKYCATYDNGATDPTAVKRRSAAPPSAQKCTDAEVACVAGPNRGVSCGGVDATCDSAPGAGDGVCDACPLRGWVTADDEMFALLGSYYCAEGVDCALPAELPRALPPTFPGL
jgi:hypothetical protein